jgi:hypothetical protein
VIPATTEKLPSGAVAVTIRSGIPRSFRGRAHFLRERAARERARDPRPESQLAGDARAGNLRFADARGSRRSGSSARRKSSVWRCAASSITPKGPSSRSCMPRAGLRRDRPQCRSIHPLWLRAPRRDRRNRACPTIEVHLSNTLAREPFRAISVIGRSAAARSRGRDILPWLRAVETYPRRSRPWPANPHDLGIFRKIGQERLIPLPIRRRYDRCTSVKEPVPLLVIYFGD